MSQPDWDAQEYAQYSRAQKIWAEELIETLSLHGTEDILDLGCGDGKVTALLAKATQGHVLGVDKNESMIALAQKSYTNIAFQVMDATTLHFDNAFDVVFSNAVLHWVDDHEAVARGIYRALKPHGKIMLQFGGYGNAERILEIMDDMIEKKYKRYFHDFKFPYSFPHSRTYTKILEEAGFKDVDARLIAKDMIHENLECFKGWIRTTWFPYVHRLPTTMREPFIDAFAQAYVDRVPQGTKIHVDMVRLEVNASI